MSELKEFLDSECWTVCPVRDFSLVHLQEFQWLSTSLPSQRLSLSPNSSPNKRQKYYFSRRFLEPTDRSKGSTPFDVDDDVVPASDGKASDVNTGAEDKAMGRPVSNGECEGTGGSGEGCGDSDEPIMTNTTLNTLRLFGKYMQMMSILRPIAVDAMLCLFQVFDYYLNSVYQLFAKEMVSLSDTSLSNDMKAQIKRIGDHLMVDERAVLESGVDPSVSNSSHNNNNKYFPPILSTVVDMSSAEGLYGLAERVVAVESLVVLSTQFQSLKPYVEELIPQEKRHILQQYFNQVVSIASDLRQPVYMWVTVRCIPYESVVAAMATTQWNIRDILSLHNPYVDQLLRELQIFSMRLNGVFASRLNARVVPPEVYRCLWEHVLRLSSRTFIEGFSEAKRCTHEGRALMQLDFQQFRQKYYFSRRFLEPTDRSKGSTPFDVDDDVVPASDGKASDVNTGAEDKAMGRPVSNGECEGTGGSGEGCGDSDEPIMTNTTLNTLRLFGKYMQMMSILRPIAVDAMLCLFQVFDYYLNSVYQLFAKEMVSLSDTSLSNDMKAQIKRIGDHLMVDERAVLESGVDPSVSNSSHNNNNKYFPPILSTVVDMSSAEGLYGLAERVVAVESLVVLSTQFQSLKPYVEELIPQEKRHILQQYFNQVVSIASDLRQPVYMWVTVRCIPYESVVAAMATTQWNIRDILSLHNPYVDQLLRELQIFSMRLNGVFASRLNARVVPPEVYRCLWEHVLRLSSRTFIEGFSEAKRCTHEGRALMQLDFQQFVSKVETMTTIRPIPERQLVDEYIKAYYLTEGALIEWIKARKEYNQKQIHGLVHCMTTDNKKMRARIVAQIGPNA
ncbi:unnamed protein product [Oppiella nova]|uniref:Syndetin C-terminal domain-containing protein n=1 Tax=Oppiella nova TaxID=334625 RepID=A0A7R9M978_9ACAR|nr:unnamed protein product [Oppiella nova]CAG2172959.1 unnamed protein product [Oppiella nova]